MMKEPMKLERARQIADDLGRAYEKFGKQLVSPYHVSDLYEALSVLSREGRWDALSEEDVTRLRRQLGAANARVKRMAKRYGETVHENEEQEE